MGDGKSATLRGWRSRAPEAALLHGVHCYTGLTLLLVVAAGLLASCGGEETATTTTASPTTVGAASPATDSTISDSQAQAIQAQIDAYQADVGALGEKMMTAEDAVAALINAKNLAATSENIATASEAAKTAATAWEEWKDRKAPIPQLDAAHAEVLKYLETMASAYPHLEQGIRTQDPNEFRTFDQLVKVAYAAKKAAFDATLNAGTLVPK